jgi:hypothetical protein
MERLAPPAHTMCQPLPGVAEEVGVHLGLLLQAYLLPEALGAVMAAEVAQVGGRIAVVRVIHSLVLAGPVVPEQFVSSGPAVLARSPPQT